MWLWHWLMMDLLQQISIHKPHKNSSDGRKVKRVARSIKLNVNWKRHSSRQLTNQPVLNCHFASAAWKINITNTLLFQTLFIRKPKSELNLTCYTLHLVFFFFFLSKGRQYNNNRKISHNIIIWNVQLVFLAMKPWEFRLQAFCVKWVWKNCKCCS